MGSLGCEYGPPKKKMNKILSTGFEKITHSINFQPQTQPKGRSLAESHHVSNIEEERFGSGEGIVITGNVTRQTNVLEETYAVKLLINSDRFLLDSFCSCAYGLSTKCKHVAAVIEYINNEESYTKTDFNQEWGKPGTREFTKAKYSKGRYYCEMFPTPEKKIVKSLPPSAEELSGNSSLRTILLHAAKDKVDCSISLFMRTVEKNIPVNITKENCKAVLLSLLNSIAEYKEDVYRSNVMISVELKKFYQENIVLTEQDIVNLCCNTISQARNENWNPARSIRVTASENVHSIKTRKRKDIQNLVNEILTGKEIQTEATQYGTKNEADARKCYEQMYNVSVKSMDFLVFPYQNWSGASLDGVVVNNFYEVTKIVEFKSPWSCRNKAIVDFSTSTCNVKYLEFVKGEVRLQRSSMYYTQCQVQMYISGMNECDLFIYTPFRSGSYCVTVFRDEAFLKEVIPVCEHFYFTHVLPALKASKEKDTAELNSNVRPFTGNDIVNMIR